VLKRKKTYEITLIILIVFSSTGCSTDEVKPTFQPSSIVTTVPQPTLTPTLPPLAAFVNDSYVLLDDFEEELKRYQAARKSIVGDALEEQEARKIVLEDLINQTLLAEAAIQNGYLMSEEELQRRINDFTNSLGDETTLEEWFDQNYYTPTSFLRMYRLSVLSSWQREKIVESVPDTVEQIHARQLYFKDEDEARGYYQQLIAGADFLSLAIELDPVTGGDLGWFPRGYLFQPEVEEAAYKLQPSEYSDVVQSQIGYHIVQVIDRDVNHALNPSQRAIIQQTELRTWIKEQREKSAIKIFIE